MNAKIFPFQKNGWMHELVAREGLVCLVRRHKEGALPHFEVIRLRQRSAHVFMRVGQEISVPAMEVYPGDEDWGTYGFSFSHASHRDWLEAAQTKFRALRQ